MGDMLIIQMRRKNEVFTKWGEKNEHEMGEYSKFITDQIQLQHRKNTYSMWSEYIIYISMCFVLFCSYVDSMLVVPMCFLIFRSETFLVLLLTNSHSTRFKPIVNYVKSMMKLNRHYFRFDFIRIEV
jgi:hypothetical protein